MPELNLVKPTEYEELMAKIQKEYDESIPEIQATLQAVTDIANVYMNVNKKISTSRRPLTLGEFLVLQKHFVDITTDAAKTFIQDITSASWDWQNQTIDMEIFAKFFPTWFERIFLKDSFSRFLPPNFPDLLKQVLEYRKQNNTKKEEKGGD